MITVFALAHMLGATQRSEMGNDQTSRCILRIEFGGGGGGGRYTLQHMLDVRQMVWGSGGHG